MRKCQLIVGLLFIMMVSWVCAEEQPKYDFKKVKWGMSREEVKASEDVAPSYENQEAVVYSTTICGLKAELYYIFNKEKLSIIGYYITEEHYYENSYITDFWAIRKALIEKYGDPIVHNIIWRDKFYEDDYKNWGFAVSIGHLVFFDTWETPRTKIELKLDGDDSKIHLSIKYTSKEFLGIEIREEKNDTTNL